MTRAAVLRDLGACRSRVLVVVAAETAGEIGVADVVRIRSPGDAHLWKNVPVVDRKNRQRRAFNCCLPGGVNSRIRPAVVILKGLRYSSSGVGPAGVSRFQQLQALLLDEG